ncbi:hypothetical protein [Rhizobacter sp. LjRoot28]|uniref:hypothetical protein n=1 Tax=Rhizobacter sp. LjRoot28 TaxID=3342309 RepID=UPI003ECC334C
MSIRLAAWLLVFVFIVSGCGGGGGGGAGGDASTSQPLPRPALAFSVQPTDQQAVDGSNARFTAVAPGADAYRWEVSSDGRSWAYAGLGSTIDLWVSLSMDGAQVRVTATGPQGEVISAPVRLTVSAMAPAVLLQPADTVATAGAAARFQLAVAGSALTVQWQSSRDGALWTSIDAGAQDGLQLPVTIDQDGLLLRAVVRNTVATVVTRNARLTVRPDPRVPVFDTEPTDIVVTAGGVPYFSASVPSSRTALQWQESRDAGATWLDLSGEQRPTLVLAAASTAADSRQYRVRATREGVSATTRVATLRVVADTPRRLSVLAGRPGGAGVADGPGMDARFDVTRATATDAQGNVYVTSACAVRRIDPTGMVRTWAGSLTDCGRADGPGNEARFSPLGGISATPSGELFVVDAGNHIIRRVAVDGTVTTFAGAPPTALPSPRRNGQGASAVFVHPRHIVRGADGNLFVTEGGSHAIRKITPDGTVTTYAGNFDTAGSAEGTVETALFRDPDALAADAEGSLYVADVGNAVVKRISSAGLVATVAGQQADAAVVDGSRERARLKRPTGLTAGLHGELYVSDQHAIRVIHPDGAISTLAGNADVLGPDDGIGMAARFSSPTGMSVDAQGALLVADGLNFNVRRVTPAGEVTTLAGRAPHSGYEDGSGEDARFRQPLGLARDASGNLFAVAGALREIAPTGQTRTYYNVAVGTSLLEGVRAAPDGTIYVADFLASVIRRVARDGTVTVLAGRPHVRGTDDGQGDAARFVAPSDLVLDADGNLYVTDSHTVRKVTPTGQVSTWVGVSDEQGNADGPVAVARLTFPKGIAMDAAGRLILAQSSCVRRVGRDRSVETLAGDCQAQGHRDGKGQDARFRFLWGIDVAPDGQLYAADFGNHTVRKVSTSGDVSTVLGVASIGSLVTGMNPLINAPRGLVMLDAGRLALTSENSVLVYTLP